jgi:hypothetical protein
VKPGEVLEFVLVLGALGAWWVRQRLALDAYGAIRRRSSARRSERHIARRTVARGWGRLAQFLGILGVVVYRETIPGASGPRWITPVAFVIFAGGNIVFDLWEARAIVAERAMIEAEST